MMTRTGTDQTYQNAKLMLSVDTSTACMTTALTRGDVLVGEITSRAERNHSLYLVPMLQRLMAEAGVRPMELDGFAVGVGPGSYTGVRIGVTVAKTFAWTHKLGLLGVSSLEAMALGGAEAAVSGVSFGLAEETVEVHEGGLGGMDRVLGETIKSGETMWLIPLIDARRGQAFTALYEAGPSGWSCAVPDSIRLTAAWTEELLQLAAERKPGRIVFTGELEQHSEAIRSFASRSTGCVEETVHGLRARHIAELGRIRWERGETEDVHGLVPNYTQLAEAEAKLLAKRS
ncbi:MULTISPECIES: tRNA (adenosine(37)-N6)-threonylcarbamoyltransferase complex dimerization subunit type 1 TsaB [unclassified Paenibacillus]|uniref:tRNA (adenosine(37)-N6)-threonylcarbamoyltransferase complex dimerization subunit type 1 TsaB n=1 Tax=unclassified Paenibacillus TaxID=185978 RepID=UPI001B4743CB|nr:MULTISPECIES: tRNA (adenosine(37)-N6)-threonylcarbamoyltransferase complex dimerization subunit type 1 TsaB [unclassified Paenibacillus]MBP1153848.1 tRNA threonylcarbamoyladenosine biosynthesis protein TsaB [Paenibacillus sp. PvP091]MBP1170767.1 tRNA threonylcarbamoyladenosine biosynthesis protein TsaB [Paenibacillus sp. PvR098]MBP2441795.1 tRNA threonylcarbamoyladenosine biosynthesis protein TsaB [Paenibacillus sp. PvP052]